MSRQRHLQWGLPEPPPPKHPYRDSFLLYGGMAVVIVLVAWLTGNDVRRSIVLAAGFFVAASAWSLFRWRGRIRREAERERAEGEIP